MNRKQRTKIWPKIFGCYPNGTLVIPNALFKTRYPNCFVWIDDLMVQRIPTRKFVGVIVSRNLDETYRVRWIADNRTNPHHGFFRWKSDLFEAL